jgi:hopanoid biosynthesis associated protein HpnK
VRTVIITGDDFGLALPVNEGIEEAHRRGILTAASLMVGAEAAADAIARAKRLPTLQVGLHVVVADGRPVLPAGTVPDLVDAQGNFSPNLVRAGVSYFFRPSVRRQLAREIRAQFEAFHRTGLALDHANAHNHMHLHPTVLGMILEIGREYGLKAMRVPHEPFWVSRVHANGSAVSQAILWAFLSPWVALVRRRLRLAGLRHNDYIFGLHHSGRMDTTLVLDLLKWLPEGVTELYFHPATYGCPELSRTMPAYNHRQELEALISPKVLEAVKLLGLRRIAFSDL